MMINNSLDIDYIVMIMDHNESKLMRFFKGSVNQIESISYLWIDSNYVCFVCEKRKCIWV